MRTTGFLICRHCKGEGRNADDDAAAAPDNGCKNRDGTGRGWLYQNPFRALGIIIAGNFVLWEWGWGAVHLVFG